MKSDAPDLLIVPERVPWDQVGVFAGLSLIMAAALSLPFYAGWLPFSGVPQIVILVIMMFTPTLATIIMLLTMDRGRRWHRRVGLGVPAVGRFFGFVAIAWFLPIILSVAAPFVAALLGWYPLDLESLSGFREVITTAAASQDGDAAAIFDILSVRSLLLLTGLNMVIGGLINVVATFGEELGWRGWLLPKLLPLGAWPAMLLTGALWGLWHAPIILLGYNYPSAPVVGVFLFTAFCMLWGVLHGWMRIATGSVWPAALMHGSLNASVGAVVFFHAAGYQPDNVWVGLIGLSGWILPTLLVVVLALLGWLPGRTWPDRDMVRPRNEPPEPRSPAEVSASG